MQDIAVRVLSALRSVTSTRAGNMCTFPAQLCDIPYGNKFGTQFVRYDYSGHDRTFGQLHLNDQQMYRRVLKLAHQYHSHLLKIADIIGGCSSGSGQGGPPSWDDGGREELVHSRQRLENNPVLEILSSNLWVRLGLLTVLCLGAFIYCLVMMEQQQAEIAGRGTNWWADMSPLTSVMSSGSSSTAPTSITPSTTRVIVGDASGGAFVGLGVQLAEESVPESTARESSTRPRTSESRYFTRQVASIFTWPSLVALISTIARSTTTALALTSETVELSDNSENTDGNQNTLRLLENSIDSHTYSLLQRNLTELSGENQDTNNSNNNREMTPVTKLRRRSKANKHGRFADNRKEEKRNRMFSGSISDLNSSAMSSLTSSRRQSVVSFASSSSITKRRSSTPVVPDNTDKGPTTSTSQLEAADNNYFLAMALMYYSYPYMYTFFRHGIPSSFTVNGRHSTAWNLRAVSDLRSRRSVPSLASRTSRDRYKPSRPTSSYSGRARPCTQWRQQSMPSERSCRSQHQREAQYQFRLGRSIHQDLKPSIRRSRAKSTRLSTLTPPSSSSSS